MCRLSGGDPHGPPTEKHRILPYHPVRDVQVSSYCGNNNCIIFRVLQMGQHPFVAMSTPFSSGTASWSWIRDLVLSEFRNGDYTREHLSAINRHLNLNGLATINFEDVFTYDTSSDSNSDITDSDPDSNAGSGPDTDSDMDFTDYSSDSGNGWSNGSFEDSDSSTYSGAESSDSADSACNMGYYLPTERKHHDSSGLSQTPIDIPPQPCYKDKEGRNSLCPGLGDTSRNELLLLNTEVRNTDWPVLYWLIGTLVFIALFGAARVHLHTYFNPDYHVITSKMMSQSWLEKGYLIHDIPARVFQGSTLAQVKDCIRARTSFYPKPNPSNREQVREYAFAYGSCIDDIRPVPTYDFTLFLLHPRLVLYQDITMVNQYFDNIIDEFLVLTRNYVSNLMSSIINSALDKLAAGGQILDIELSQIYQALYIKVATSHLSVRESLKLIGSLSSELKLSPKIFNKWISQLPDATLKCMLLQHDIHDCQPPDIMAIVEESRTIIASLPDPNQNFRVGYSTINHHAIDCLFRKRNPDLISTPSGNIISTTEAKNKVGGIISSLYNPVETMSSQGISYESVAIIEGNTNHRPHGVLPSTHENHTHY